MIPKILLQTSKEKLPQYVLDNINKHTAGWEYIHFVDSEIIEFFNQNPITELPDIVDVFNKIDCGEYKADIFRYYFLYLKGGVFADSDLEIKADLNYYADNFNYFTVAAAVPNDDSYFQGFLGVEPNNKILHEALLDVYNLFKTNTPLARYNELCERFKQISLKYESEYVTKLFGDIDQDGYTQVVDTSLNNQIIAQHFHIPGMIPPPVDYAENTSRAQLVRTVYLNRLKREPDEGGLNYYVNSNLRPYQIDDVIANSIERKLLNGYIDTHYGHHSFRFYTHNKSEHVTDYILQFGSWEPPLVDQWYNHINEGDLVLDIGANIGWYTKIANLKGATSIAFEPDPKNFKILEKNSCPRNELYNICAGNNTEDVMLQLSDDNFGDNRTSTEGDIICRQNTVDNIVGDRAKQVRAIKIDTQGWEPNIILGAINTLKNVADDCLIIMEYWPFGLYRNGFNFDTYQQLFDIIGATPEYIPHNIDFDQYKNNPSVHCDIILRKLS